MIRYIRNVCVNLKLLKVFFIVAWRYGNAFNVIQDCKELRLSGLAEKKKLDWRTETKGERLKFSHTPNLISNKHLRSNNYYQFGNKIIIATYTFYY